MSIELLNKAERKGDIKNTLHQIPLSAIRSHPAPIRKDFSEEAVIELSESIYHIGLLHPILVKEYGDHYEIVSGERRFRAYQLLDRRYPSDFSEIPSILIDSKLDTRVFSLTENIQREPLGILEECEAIYSLIETVKGTYGGIGKLLGKTNDYIENRMRYLRIHKALKSRITSFGPPDPFYERFNRLALSKVLTLKPLLSHWSAEECYECLVEMVEGDLSLREIKVRLCDHQEKRMDRKEVMSSQQGSKALQRESKELPIPIKIITQINKVPSDQGIIMDKDFWPPLLKVIQDRLKITIHNLDPFQAAVSDLIHQYGKPFSD